MMGTLLQDLRYGVRMLLKNPGFTVIAVMALALGIGVNTAIFSVVNAVLLRPLPFDNPDQIVTAWGRNPDGGKLRANVSYPDFADWQAQTQSFQQLAAYNTSGTLLRNDGEEAEALSGTVASADLLPLLNVQPILGRNFTREEDRTDSAPVILLGYDVWRRRFNADPSIVGKQIRLSSRSATVLGVLPPGFKFPIDTSRTEFLQPLAPNIGENVKRRSSYFLKVVGRLKSGVTVKQAEVEMQAIGARLEQQFPDEGFRLGWAIVPMHEDLVGNVRSSLLVLLGAVGFVLLIACANVANLLLARAASRHKEIAIRRALGAGRLRVLRQLLTESLLLSIMGGTLGLLLAMWGVDLLVAQSPLDIPRLREIGLDARVLSFTLAISALTGIIFGLAPALHSSKVDLNDALKEGGRGSTEGNARNRVRSLLVISEIALSLVLLVGAGLLIKSFMRLRAVDPGFDASHVLVTPLSPSKAKYAEIEQQRNFLREVLGRLEAVPGVEAAALVSPLPLSGNASSKTFTYEGQAVTAKNLLTSNFREISPNYFRARSIPLLKGRAFHESDTKDTPLGVVVNETFVRRFFPHADPLGKRILIGADPTENANPPLSEIIGVVGDVHHGGLDMEAGPEYYVSYQQDRLRNLELVVRTKTDNPLTLSTTIRSAIKQVDQEQYIPAIETMDQLLAESVARRRFNMMLLGLFAALALLLAAVGIYGVMSYSVTQRTHEIGIRLALGAQTGDVLRMVVRQGMTLAFVGVGIGLAAAFIVTRIMSSLLFGVSPTDALTFGVVAMLLLGIALLACLIPARRATRVDPMVALRYE
jgi:putative ABC transport system permease protein